MDDRGEIDPTQLAEAEALGRATAAATGGGVGAGGEGLDDPTLPWRMKAERLRRERDRWRALCRGLVAENFRRDGVPADRIPELLGVWTVDAEALPPPAGEGGAA